MSNEEYISGEEHKKLKIDSSENHAKRVTLRISYIAIACVVLLVAVAAFFGGIEYQKHHEKATSILSSRFSQNGGVTQFSGGSRRFAGVLGQVTSVSSDSITVSNSRTGSSSTYAINTSTTITNNGESVPASSIQTGDTVMIMSSSSSSTTASRILVNPSFGGPMTTGSGAGGGSATTN